MFWADELAAGLSGPQVVNDSKTPSGTVHVGSLRGVVLHDAIARALRDHGLATEFRYGVDDLDPMDAQALLTPDAVDRYMGVPLAHVPAPEGSDAPSYARYFVGRAVHGDLRRAGHHADHLLDERAVRRRHHGPLYPHRARQRGADPGALLVGQQGGQGARLAAPLGHLRELRQGRHHARHGLGWHDRRLRLQTGPRDVGEGLRPHRPGRAGDGSRQAPLQRGLGRQVEPVRHHRRGLRQGSRHGRRVARPHPTPSAARCSTGSRR